MSYGVNVTGIKLTTPTASNFEPEITSLPIGFVDMFGINKVSGKAGALNKAVNATAVVLGSKEESNSQQKEPVAKVNPNPPPVKKKPKPPANPSLKTLLKKPHFTEASYGVPLPIVYGTDRVTGNVIWSSGFTKRYVTIKKKKFYYMTTDFALAISAGPIQNVLKIWLGDKVIYSRKIAVNGSGVAQATNGRIYSGVIELTNKNSPLRKASASKHQTKVKIFNGSESQIPEGIMATELGYDDMPSYRGVAYILFENFICDDETIPDITVEVLANTETTNSRLSGSNTDANMNEARFSMLYDQSYNRLHVNTFGGGYGGWSSFNANTLEEAEHTELNVASSLGDNTTGDVIGWHKSWLTSNGQIVFVTDDTGPSTFYIADPFTQKLTDSLNNADWGVGNVPTAYGSCMGFFRGSDGLPKDILCALDGAGSGSIAFIEIDPFSGSLSAPVSHAYEYTSDSTHTMIGTILDIDSAFASTKPRFSDKKLTSGTHLFVLSYSDTNDAFIIHRSTVDSKTKSISNVETVFAYVGTVTEFPDFTSVMYSFVDPVDKTILYWCQNTNDAENDLLICFNPYTGAIDYARDIPKRFSVYSTKYQSTMPATLFTQELCYLDVDFNLVKLDLADGTYTTLVSDITTDGFGTPTYLQYYNAFENSVTYSDGAQQIWRIYAEVQQRQTVPVSSLVGDLLTRVGVQQTDYKVTDVSGLTVSGMSIYGPISVADVIEDVGKVYRFDIVESNGALKYSARGGASSFTIDNKYLANTNDNGWLSRADEYPFSKVRQIALSYRDEDREYAENTQIVILPNLRTSPFESEAPEDVATSLVMSANEARKLGEVLVYEWDVSNTTYEFQIPFRFIKIDPADAVTLQMNSDSSRNIRIRVDNISYSDNSIRVTGFAEDADVYNDSIELLGNTGSYAADEIGSLDARVDVLYMDMPFRNYDEAKETSTEHFLFFTFLNRSPEASIDSLGDEASVVLNGTDAYSVTTPSDFPTWGYVTQTLTYGTDWYSTDTASELIIRLEHTGDVALESAASLDAIITDSSINLAWVGGELINFQTVTSLGSGLYKLTNINRVLFGTEYAIGTHAVGEYFVLLSDKDGTYSTAILRADCEPATTNAIYAVQTFLDTDNPFQPSPVGYFTPLNLRPVNVGNLQGEYSGSDLVISWVQRSRYDGDDWADGGDTVPTLEGVYNIFVYTDPATFNELVPSSYVYSTTTTATTETFTAAEQVAAGFDRTTEDAYIAVYQSGANTRDAGSAFVIKVPHV